jgi:hypothetical protein
MLLSVHLCGIERPWLDCSASKLGHYLRSCTCIQYDLVESITERHESVSLTIVMPRVRFRHSCALLGIMLEIHDISVGSKP